MGDCIYCGRPLDGEHDGWAHAACEQVVKADYAANEIHDNGELEDVEYRLREAGRCPWQIQAQGWDGGAVYCGRLTGGDWCLEHERQACGDEAGADEERAARTSALLGARL